MNFTTVGFVGEYTGGDTALTYFRPVVVVDGTWHVAMRNHWTKSDLSPLSEAQHEWVNFLPRNGPSIAEGNLIWIVGAGLYNRCQRLDLGDFGQRFKGWPIFRGPFSFSSGPMGGLQSLSRALYNTTLPYFQRALFSPKAWPGEVDELMQVMTGLCLLDEHDLALARGLYFFEGRDIDKYQLTRVSAVASGRFESDEQFNRLIEERRTWLATSRFSEELRQRGSVVVRQSEITMQIARRIAGQVGDVSATSPPLPAFVRAYLERQSGADRDSFT